MIFAIEREERRSTCQDLYYDHAADAFLFELVAVSEHCRARLHSEAK
jgi:hypothetical protein